MKHIEQEKRRQDYWKINSIIKEVKDNMRIDGDEPTAEEVLKYMLGDQDGWCGGEFVVYRYTKPTKRNTFQRFNMLWFMPLFIVSIPFQYLLTGSWGASRNSKIGRVIDWLIKFER